MNKDIISSEEFSVIVGMTGTREELKKTTFKGVKIPLEKPLSMIEESDQSDLGIELAELAVKSGLLSDPLFVERSLMAVAIIDQTISHDVSEPKRLVSRAYHYLSEIFVSGRNIPPIVESFTRSLDDRRTR